MRVVPIAVVMSCLGCGRISFDALPDAIPVADATRVPVTLAPGFPVTANINTTPGTEITTTSLSVEANQLLVAVMVWGTGGTDQEPIGVEGGGLVWTRRAYSTFPAGVVPPGTSGDGIWTAWADAPQTFVMKGTRGTTMENTVMTLAVYAFTGAAPTTGAIGTHNAQAEPTALLVDVDATAAGSWIIGGFHHGTANMVRAPNAMTTWDIVDDPAMSVNGHFHAIGRSSTPTSGPGRVTIGSEALGPYSLTSAVEVLAADS